MVEFEIFSLVIMFELLTIIPIKQYFEKSQEEKKDQNNIVNESSIDKEVIESLFDQFSSSVFVLNKDFTIHNQNFKSKKIYNLSLIHI